ncbi:MAG TPA: ComF family protein [Clostridia bacterium]|nr:ComF family protein [Clostridia bacterium]
MQVKNLLESCLRALYPYDARCFACGMEAPLNEACLCEACSIKIRRAGELTAPDGLCGLYAAFYYDEPLHRAVHSFKYLNARYLARYFAAAFSLPKHWEFDVIVPVPLHPKRLRRRGYNQSALLAVLLSKQLGVPIEGSLLRRRLETQPQAGLSSAERKENMLFAFNASNAVRGRSILLIDDVVTTASTLSACAMALNEKGAAKVYAACACAAPLIH